MSDDMFPCKQLPMTKEGKDNWDDIFKREESKSCNDFNAEEAELMGEVLAIAEIFMEKE